MIMGKERARKTLARKIEALFNYTDYNNDGIIDVHEFLNAFADSGLRTWLAAMGLEVRDSFQFFEFLDADGDGQITVHQFVDGVGRLKGAATSYDMVSIEKCNMKLTEDLQLMQHQLKRIEDTLLL